MKTTIFLTFFGFALLITAVCGLLGNHFSQKRKIARLEARIRLDSARIAESHFAAEGYGIIESSTVIGVDSTSEATIANSFPDHSEIPSK